MKRLNLENIVRHQHEHRPDTTNATAWWTCSVIMFGKLDQRGLIVDAMLNGLKIKIVTNSQGLVLKVGNPRFDDDSGDNIKSYPLTEFTPHHALSAETMVMVKYYIEEKGDVTRYTGWDSIKDDVQAEYPELIHALLQVEIAERTLKAVLASLPEYDA